MKFDGNDNYVFLGTSNPVEENITISAMVKWDGLNSAWQTIMAKRDDYKDGRMMWELKVDLEGNLVLRCPDSVANFGVGFPETNVWTHLVLTKDQTDVKLFLNGVLAGSGSMSFGTGEGARLTIGGLASGRRLEAFNGVLDEVKLYDRALTSGEVDILSSPDDIWIPDSDEDGLPDSWEVLHFASLQDIATEPEADFDRDGQSNQEEFIAGTNPTDPAYHRDLMIECDENGLNVSFLAREASGIGYQGVVRYYTLEKSSSIDGVWESFQAVPAEGLIVTHAENVPSDYNFYRVKVSLE